ncbi:uncharacterized protein LOC132703289 isoform X2 [Cylas formicarius]|uniref:uncharacterized protein LOC132703289 isoform X2 n=1 Tax=Cylas formicarius TaxID=197179 RepID=UPI002958AD4C|nr:uncharacterized protein LOC132703289 isoform X2 [Cylas formicarius]
MFAFTSLCVLVGSSFFIILLRVLDKNPVPLFGVYRRRSGLYWIKVWIMYTVLTLKKVTSRFTNYEEYYDKIDKPQELSHHSKAVDAVNFNGANKNGDYFIFATARRKNRLIDGLFFLKVANSNMGVLTIPKIPDTTLFNDGDEDKYEAEGIQISCVEPMKKWKLTYAGVMKNFENPDQQSNVTLDAVWTSEQPCFNFDKDMDAWDMAKAIAYERWSRNYFANLEKNHQVHYEQFGTLKAHITINGSKYNIEVDALRDHSVATKREWAQFRRYGMHFFSAENGDHFSVGSICLPISFSRLNVGFVYSARERNVYAIRKSNLRLYNHGEMGRAPRDYAFSFKAGKTI